MLKLATWTITGWWRLVVSKHFLFSQYLGWLTERLTMGWRPQPGGSTWGNVMPQDLPCKVLQLLCGRCSPGALWGRECNGGKALLLGISQKRQQIIEIDGWLIRIDIGWFGAPAKKPSTHWLGNLVEIGGFIILPMIVLIILHAGMLHFCVYAKSVPMIVPSGWLWVVHVSHFFKLILWFTYNPLTNRRINSYQLNNPMYVYIYILIYIYIYICTYTPRFQQPLFRWVLP